MNRFLTRYLIIHHTVIPQEYGQEKTLGIILAAHKAAGLAYDGRIAYHYVIGDGWVTQGRSENTVGYHAGNWLMNLQSIAICLNGNFNIDQPTDYQKQKLTTLLRELMRKYNIPRERVKLHREVRNEPTACPGAHITQSLIDSLLNVQPQPAQNIALPILFQEIWGRPGAPGEIAYFQKRLDNGSITDQADLREKMTYWYQTVYPNGKYSAEGDAKWQRAKSSLNA